MVDGWEGYELLWGKCGRGQLDGWAPRLVRHVRGVVL